MSYPNPVLSRPEDPIQEYPRTSGSSYRSNQKHPCLSIALALAALLLGGCATSQTMRIHLAAADLDKDKPTVKFYRITIHGCSTNEKSTLQTGYYDANALHALFGEVKKDETNMPGTIRPAGSLLFRMDPASKNWTILPPSELFAIMYGADADALSKALTSYFDATETGASMGRLMAQAAGGDTLVAAVAAERKQAATETAAKQLAKTVKTQSATLMTMSQATAPEDYKPAAVDEALLTIGQSAVTQLGSSSTISTDDPDKAFIRLQELYTLLSQN